jgi:O-antigen/teichoic acid export membrane protein
MALHVSSLSRGINFVQTYLRQNWTLLFNSAAGIVMRLIPAVSGYVFQLIVTTSYVKATVGLVNGITLSLASTIGMFSMLGIGTYLVSRIHSATTDRSALLSSGLLVGSLAGVAVGLLFGLIAPFALAALSPIRLNPAAIAVIAIGGGLTTFVLIFEEVLVGLLLGGYTVARAVMFSLLRVAFAWALICLLGPVTPLLPVLAWIGADVLSTAVLIAYGSAKGKLPNLTRPRLNLIRAGARPSLEHHLLSIGLNVSGWFVPLVIGAVLTADQFASYAVAWQNTSFAFTVPFALCSVLFGAGIQNRAAVGARTRQLLLIGLAGCAATIGLFWFALPYLMRGLGEAYVAEGTLAARLIVVAVIPVLIKGMWTTIERIHGRMLSATRTLLLCGVLELSLPAVGGALFGIGGACGGWLFGQVLLGFYFVGPLLREMRVQNGQSPVQM